LVSEQRTTRDSSDVLTADGRTGEEFHNAFPVIYDKSIHDALEASDSAGDWLAYARSGYTGASQYVPFVWSGDPAASFEDSDGLPSMVPAGVNLGISGAPQR
jgi:alpha-glucosidase (family GH31 glycosyl hydrolase)